MKNMVRLHASLLVATTLALSTMAFHTPIPPSRLDFSLRMAASTDNYFRPRKQVAHEGEPLPLPKMTREEWHTHIKTSDEIAHIREELIGRYARNGFNREYAKEQVEAFLMDPAQSVPFLEMRHFAKTSKKGLYGDDGLTGDLTLVLAAVVMFLGTVGVRLLTLYNDYQAGLF